MSQQTSSSPSPAAPFDLIVIGAGPGGYVAAIHAAQLGLKVACVEKQYLGGTCLNVGCIPSKALLESSHRFHMAKHSFAKHGIVVTGELKLDMPAMMKRKDEVVKGLVNGVAYLFKKHKVTHLPGAGKILKPGQVEVTGADGAKTTYSTKNILIATGSAPIQLPGLTFDGKNIVSSTEALTFTEVPKKLMIVGGGYIGVELGSVWARLGSEVTIVEFTPGILPISDREMANALQKSLAKQGINFVFETAAQSAKPTSGGVVVTLKGKESTSEMTVDKVVVAVGRKPFTEGLGLENVGIVPNKRGFVEVDEHYQTNVPGIYAIGDVIGKIMLAHNAEEEGTAAVENMAGKHGHVNYIACPAVVYTHPELGSVGLTEEQAKEKGYDSKIGKFQFIANGRVRGMDETEGFVKVIGDKKTDRVLGVHILAAHASDVLAEAALGMEYSATCEDIGRVFHAHPTMSEALKQAVLAVDGMQTQS